MMKIKEVVADLFFEMEDATEDQVYDQASKMLGLEPQKIKEICER